MIRNVLYKGNPLSNLNIRPNLINYLSINDGQQLISPENENENKSSFLISNLNEKVQIFLDSFEIFSKDDSTKNQSYLIDSIEQLKKKLLLFSKIYENPKFYLSNFPYDELYQLILTSDIKTIISNSLECIKESSKIDLNFNEDMIPESIIEKLQFFLSGYPEIESVDIIIEFISIIIQYLPQLCNIFISSGLFQVFDDLIRTPSCIHALESVIIAADKQYIPATLSYCRELLISDDSKIIEKALNCFGFFILHSGFDNIDSDIVELLYDVIREQVDKTKIALEICLLFSDDIPYPPDILPYILDTLKDPCIDAEMHILCLNIMLHFQTFWKDSMSIEEISETLLFGAQNKEYETSLKFAECIISYHKFDDFSFDKSIFEICIDFLESNIYPMCIFKMYEIMDFDASNFPDQISQIIDLMTSDVVEIISNYANGDEIEEEDINEAASLIMRFLSKGADDDNDYD